MNLHYSSAYFVLSLSFLCGNYNVRVLVFQVTLVVNYDLPAKNTSNRNAPAEPDYETYLHRIGRSGRFGRKGMFGLEDCTGCMVKTMICSLVFLLFEVSPKYPCSFLYATV